MVLFLSLFLASLNVMIEAWSSASTQRRIPTYRMPEWSFKGNSFWPCSWLIFFISHQHTCTYFCIFLVTSSKYKYIGLWNQPKDSLWSSIYIVVKGSNNVPPSGCESFRWCAFFAFCSTRLNALDHSRRLKQIYICIFRTDRASDKKLLLLKQVKVGMPCFTRPFYTRSWKIAFEVYVAHPFNKHSW